MKTDQLTEILGYTPGHNQKLEFLKQVKETGKSIQDVASNYQLPELFIKDSAGLIEFKGERMTPEQFKEKHPFIKFVTISTKK